MLNITRLSKKSASSKNNGSRLTLSINDNSRSDSKRNNGNDEVDRFGVSSKSVKHA